MRFVGWAAAVVVGIVLAWALLHVFISPVNPKQEPARQAPARAVLGVPLRERIGRDGRGEVGALVTSPRVLERLLAPVLRLHEGLAPHARCRAVRRAYRAPARRPSRRRRPRREWGTAPRARAAAPVRSRSADSSPDGRARVPPRHPRRPPRSARSRSARCRSPAPGTRAPPPAVRAASGAASAPSTEARVSSTWPAPRPASSARSEMNGRAVASASSASTSSASTSPAERLTLDAQDLGEVERGGGPDAHRGSSRRRDVARASRAGRARSGTSCSGSRRVPCPARSPRSR